MRFLGICLNEQVLDSRTMWDFEDKLAQAELIDEMFFMFDEKLEEEGLITRKGTIIDATFVDVPKQRNSRDENKNIKNGEIPEDWKKPEDAPKLAQKDTDARWAKKNNETHFGYKDHIKCDADSKLITHYAVTNAAVHDSQRSTVLLDDTDEVLYADSAYSSAEIVENLPKDCKNLICFFSKWAVKTWFLLHFKEIFAAVTSILGKFHFFGGFLEVPNNKNGRVQA